MGKETRFHGWVIDPIKHSIEESPGAVLVDSPKAQQKWIYDVGIYNAVHGVTRAKAGRLLIQGARMQTGDHLFVDEDGYGKEGLGVFWLAGYPYPLCGRGMVVSAEKGHEEWIYGIPNVSLAQLRAWVRFTDTVTTGHVMPARDASEAEIAAILPPGTDADQWFKLMGTRGIVCGHPITRASSVGLDVYENRDGA